MEFATVYRKGSRQAHIAFYMEEKNGEWKIISASKVPDWIINIQNKLEAAILENVAE